MSSDETVPQRRVALPEKKYFKIGEVADLVGVEPHVLRYWETQFPQLRPHKARSGHRLYRRREVETLLVIRELLHVQRFTIAGARQALRQPGGAASILPRFFDVSGSAAGASTFVDGPPDLDVDPDGDGDGDGDGELQEVDVEGLPEAELRAAMSREQVERVSRGGVAEVDVLAEDDEPPLARAPRPLLGGRLGLGAAQRALVEGALADARTILALLDREDRRARPTG